MRGTSVTWGGIVDVNTDIIIDATRNGYVPIISTVAGGR